MLLENADNISKIYILYHTINISTIYCMFDTLQISGFYISPEQKTKANIRDRMLFAVLPFVCHQISFFLELFQLNQKNVCSNKWFHSLSVRYTSLLACWHWRNIGTTLKFQQLKYCCWSKVDPLSSEANDGPTHAFQPE